MRHLDTLGQEEVHVGRRGAEAITLTVRCPEFGRIAQVRVDRDQAASLAGALTGLALDEPDGLASLRD